jgi:hypothetical protein
MSTNTTSLSIIYSNKGSPQLVLDRFVFKLNKRTETKIYWKCTEMNCPAHIHTDINNNLLSTNGKHDHLPDSEDFAVKKFRAVLKERVMNETVPIQKIYDEEIVKANFAPDALASVPQIHHMRMTTFTNISLLFFSLESGLNRTRRKLTPKLPTSNLFDIPVGYQTTASGETFLICDKMVSRKKRMLIFSSPKQLQLLFEGSMVFLDGTFQATPPFFDQIFTIHCLKFNFGIIYILFYK